MSGTIKSLSVDFNSRVKKGQLIALIDPEMFEAQVAQARANQGKADATFLDAERSLKRNRELFSRNLVPRSDLDTATGDSLRMYAAIGDGVRHCELRVRITLR